MLLDDSLTNGDIIAAWEGVENMESVARGDLLRVAASNEDYPRLPPRGFILLKRVPRDAIPPHGGRAMRSPLRGCLIRINWEGPDEWLSPLIQHEIGHCYGFRHSDNELDIMHPSGGKTWSEENARELQRLAR